MNADVQALTAALLDALDIRVPFGSVTLNMNESQVESVETKVKIVVRRRLTAERILDPAKRC